MAQILHFILEKLAFGSFELKSVFFKLFEHILKASYVLIECLAEDDNVIKVNDIFFLSAVHPFSAPYASGKFPERL